MDITKDFVLDNTLEFCRKVKNDSKFEREFHRAAEQIEEGLSKDRITLTSNVDQLKGKREINHKVEIIDGKPKIHHQETIRNYEIKINTKRTQDKVKGRVYHEAGHLLFHYYRSFTEDYFLKETEHPAIKKAHNHIKNFRESQESSIFKYLSPHRFMDRKIPPNLENMEDLDRKTRKRALDWLDEVATNKLGLYYKAPLYGEISSEYVVIPKSYKAKRLGATDNETNF